MVGPTSYSFGHVRLGLNKTILLDGGSHTLLIWTCQLGFKCSDFTIWWVPHSTRPLGFKYEDLTRWRGGGCYVIKNNTDWRITILIWCVYLVQFGGLLY